MKKIVTILLSFILFVTCYAQFPKQLVAYAPLTQITDLGASANDSGLVFRTNFADTVAANRGFLKNIPNIIIVVNDSLWKRSNDATFWMRVGSGSGGGGGNTIYTGDGSLSGDRILDLGGHILQFNNGEDVHFKIETSNEQVTLYGHRLYQITTDGGATTSWDMTSNESAPNVRALLDLGDGVGTSALHLFADSDNGYMFLLSAFDGTKTETISTTTGSIAYTADTHTFNGNVLVSTLNTSGSALATSGIRQQIISDANGLLSFTNKTFSALTYGATTTWDYTTGANKTLVLIGDANLVPSNVQNGDFGTLIVVQDGSGGHELTVPDEVITINTDPGDTTVLGFAYDGTVYYWTTSLGGGGGQALTISSPLTGTSYDGTAPVSIGIQNAVADGSTKGAASFTANDFNATTGNISIDYTNGQAANGSTKGFLVAADWTTFNNKAPTASPTFTGTVTIPTPFTLGATSVTSTGTQLNYLNAATGTTGTTSTNLVFSTSPTLVTPTLGAATATTINGNTFTTGTYTLTGQAGKTLTFNGSITLTGTDAQTYTFPTTSATLARTDAANTFTGVQTLSSAPVLSTATLTANSVTHTFPSVAGTVVEYSTSTSAATATPAGDAKVNDYYLTALNVAPTFSAPSGSLTNGNILIIRIKDNGTARVLAWNAIYIASPDLPLPTTTILGKTMYLTFVYNSATPGWNLVGMINNFGFDWVDTLIALVLAGFLTAAEGRLKRRKRFAI